MKSPVKMAYVVAGALVAGCGCAELRGTRLGHWTGIGDGTPLVHITESTGYTSFTGRERFLLLPVSGNIPNRNAETLQSDLYKEACNYFPVNVAVLPSSSPAAGYAVRNNLLADGDLFNVREVGRLGALLGASHVVSVYVREFRPYHPQVIVLRLAVIEVASRRLVMDVDATFDASQQQVVAALNDYMQQRRAREHNAESLDMMLRSPSEFAAFVSDCCCRSIARTFWTGSTQRKMACSGKEEIQTGNP